MSDLRDVRDTSDTSIATFEIWKGVMLQFWYVNKGVYSLNKEIPPEYLESVGYMVNGLGATVVPGTNLTRLYDLYKAGKCPGFDSTYLVGYFTNDNGFDAAITISRELRIISVTFRGSSEPLDWLTNLNLFQTSMEVSGIDIPAEAKVHLGAWNQLRKDDCIGQIVRVVYELAQQFDVDGKGDYYIVISGHSLGGGLADIFAYIFQLYLEQRDGLGTDHNICLITYNPTNNITHYIADYLKKSGLVIICMIHEYDPAYALLYNVYRILGYTYAADRVYRIRENGDVRIGAKDEPPKYTEWDLVKGVILGEWNVFYGDHGFDNFMWIDSLTLVGATDGAVPTNPVKVLIDEHKRLMDGVAPPTTQEGVAPTGAGGS